MAPKGIKKLSKNSSSKNSIATYDNKIEKKKGGDLVNTMTLIPISSETYALGPIPISSEANTFPFVTSKE